MSKIIREFFCKPTILVHDSEKFKIYGAEVDTIKYPELQLNKYNNISLLGNIHNLGLGIEYKVKAEEKKGSYGYQYNVIHIQRDKPNDERTTRMFLSEILTLDQVDTIMKSYPDIVDRVIKNKLDDIDLKKLHNIGQFRFNIIKQRIEENFILAELVKMFQGLIGISTIKKLHEQYPSAKKIKQEMQERPYPCLCSLTKIGFRTADGIILELDKESKRQKDKGENPSIYFNFDIKTSTQRAFAAIDYLLEQNENNGHTKMSISELKKIFDKLVPECNDKFVEAIKTSDKFHIDKKDKTISFLSTYETEMYIAERLIEGLKIKNEWEDIEIEEFKNTDDSELTDEQFESVKMSYKNNISILIGGAGTGKSHTTQAIISLIKRMGKSFILLAPTGRASRVLAGYTKEDASTIHRGLAYNPMIPPYWHYNENDKLPHDFIIVDETSMTDVFLLKRLIEAIDFSRTKLMFIGDDFQIPSVGAGNVLYDLINSGVIPITSLTKVFRFGIGGISTVSTKTRYGERWIEDKDKNIVFGEDKSYIYMPVPQGKLVNTVKNLYLKLMNGGTSPENILILSSYNIGDYGTEKINEIIQEVANKNYDSDVRFKSGDTTYYLDDMVIQTKNNYKAVVYDPETLSIFSDEEGLGETFISNGDIGKVILIDKGYMVVQFDNERIVYNKDESLNLKLAYSISLYKSQGGSAENIILMTPKAHTFMLNANLIYVGQTRAEKRCYHLGEAETIIRSMKKKANLTRNTYLKDLLKRGIK